MIVISAIANGKRLKPMNESILFYISAIGLPSVWMIVAIYIAYLLDKLFSRETKP